MVIVRRILITRIYEGQGFRRTTRERPLVLRVPVPGGGVIVPPGRAAYDVVQRGRARWSEAERVGMVMVIGAVERIDRHANRTRGSRCHQVAIAPERTLCRRRRRCCAASISIVARRRSDRRSRRARVGQVHAAALLAGLLGTDAGVVRWFGDRDRRRSGASRALSRYAHRPDARRACRLSARPSRRRAVDSGDLARSR